MCEGIDNDQLVDDAMESLGFCQCGMPEKALLHIRDGLKLLGKWSDEGTPYDEWHECVEKHFKSYGASYFFWYWCDKEGLSEHGGAVPGWLTDRGREVLASLEEIDLEAYSE